jgi:hypothetical protein
MTASVRLDETGFVTLDGSGNGTVKIGPLTAREVWHPANVHVSANQNATNEAQCLIYMGDIPARNNFRDGTFSGSAGDSTDALNADVIKCGSKVIAVWSGGDAGVVATLNVTGRKDV